MATIELRDVRKAYGRVEVISGVSVAAAEGEFLALVGPSGCGKSTLLRMIAGLETVTDGEILIGGEVVNDLAPRERDVAMVFQSYALYPNLTVARNMGQPLRLAGRPRAEIARRVADAARILSLTPLLDRYPRQLSGGQRQRVAMGRAIVRDPKLFLFDEPLSNLDAKLRVSMRSEIKALHQRLGTTIIYVTHDQIEAMTMADRIVVLRDGRVEQVGTPIELYENPANSFVATFIGSPSMNLVEGTVQAGRFVADGAASLPLDGAAALDGRRIVLGVRPEHLQIGDDGLPATVRTVEPTGPETYVTMIVADADVVGVFKGNVALPFGTEVRIAPLANRIHLFDPGTGERILL